MGDSNKQKKKKSSKAKITFSIFLAVAIIMLLNAAPKLVDDGYRITAIAIFICSSLLAIISIVVLIKSSRKKEKSNKIERAKNIQPLPNVAQNQCLANDDIEIQNAVEDVQEVQNDVEEVQEIQNDVEDTQLEDINRFVSEFMVNEKIVTIIKGYVLTNTIRIGELEFAVLPLKASYKYYKSRYDYDIQVELQVNHIENLEETDYIKFVKKFDNEILHKHRKEVIGALEGRYNTNTDKMAFRGIQNLYLTLVRTNYIEDSSNKCNYYAFLYLIYRFKKELYYQEAQNRLDCYDIDMQASDDEIVKKLYANDIESALIVTTLWARKEYLNNYNCLFCEEFAELCEYVDSVLQKINDTAVIDGLLNNQEKQTEYRYTMADIDLMSGEEFEWFVTYLFNKLGYTAKRTKSSGDQGVDVVAQKGKTKVAIQTKHYSKPVGNSAVQEVVSGGKYYSADKTMVVTNNVFTKSAKDLAEVNNVILWNRYTLEEKLKEIYN